ncbi:type II toxin-antitoxin system RelE/ParE family toxin [Streptococcus downei]|uniref:Toxin to DNA-damage-inducible protein J n=1 Tax=Streptococcus downei MFe28 TaxID=764290 RepID=A0A380JFH9_STRDO|nr:type II toxin-antitoxin system RelE/ParE family toxin [Streptococcus downei]EFQ56258.1 addiction module toxin, RelE/StbE family [Streptococcus downei F0415]SUN35796.1 Toxin to DNA-damage-inducible protein J [Streptococcus downei MFe28]
MAYKIVITPEAEEDLDQIYSYISQHFLSVQAADGTLANIKKTIVKLLEIPDLGIDVSNRLGRVFSESHRLRMILAGNYLVFYIVDQSSIVILRVLYQKRNWIELFKK